MPEIPIGFQVPKHTTVTPVFIVFSKKTWNLKTGPELCLTKRPCLSYGRLRPYHLNAATEIKDMNYPGSFLHQLSGDKKGLYSVKVSGNWRVFFKFEDGDAYIVNYDDYH
jgi:hypothetical protein